MRTSVGRRLMKLGDEAAGHAHQRRCGGTGVSQIARTAETTETMRTTGGTPRTGDLPLEILARIVGGRYRPVIRIAKKAMIATRFANSIAAKLKPHEVYSGPEGGRRKSGSGTQASYVSALPCIPRRDFDLRSHHI